MAKCMREICTASCNRSPMLSLVQAYALRSVRMNISLCKMQNLTTHPDNWTAIAILSKSVPLIPRDPSQDYGLEQCTSTPVTTKQFNVVSVAQA